MTAEPITIFSAKIDPEGVLACLRSMSPNHSIVQDAGGWSKVTMVVKRGLLRQPLSITFTHARNYYLGSDFPKQIRGMQGYFARFPKNHLTQRLMATIASFRFAVSVFPPPEPPVVIGSDDERLKFIYAVAKYLDGAIFTPSGLRDASGRIICHATLPPDADVILPTPTIDAPLPSKMPRYWGGTLPNPPSPPPHRVAKRTLCLLAAAYRGMLEREQDNPARLEATRVDFLKWVDGAGIKGELEPCEQELLHSPIHKGNARKLMEAEWLIEGAAILAWALNKLELPAYDAEVDVGIMDKACGLATPEKALAFQKHPELRNQADIERLSTQMLALHWRLRENRLKPGKKDFETESQQAWFGTMPLEGIRFIAGDLAIRNVAIHEVSEVALVPLELSIQERHRAVNWLCGVHEIYSKTDTPT